ncbi:hypothetical protein B0H10DRAFT_2002621 [Mycena sp. CBHHK59/15]|nr:hypothetical protein B0H10DRAFT_2002621 [Mycena sp. CBHHK59/15]
MEGCFWCDLFGMGPVQAPARLCRSGSDFCSKSCWIQPKKIQNGLTISGCIYYSAFANLCLTT